MVERGEGSKEFTFCYILWVGNETKFNLELFIRVLGLGIKAFDKEVIWCQLLRREIFLLLSIYFLKFKF